MFLVEVAQSWSPYACASRQHSSFLPHPLTALTGDSSHSHREGQFGTVVCSVTCLGWHCPPAVRAEAVLSLQMLGGCPGLVGSLLYWYEGRDEWWAPACFFGGQCAVLVAPAMTRLALCHESVLLDRVWALKLEAVQTKRAGSSKNLRCERQGRPLSTTLRFPCESPWLSCTAYRELSCSFSLLSRGAQDTKYLPPWGCPPLASQSKLGSAPSTLPGRHWSCAVGMHAGGHKHYASALYLSSDCAVRAALTLAPSLLELP